MPAVSKAEIRRILGVLETRFPDCFRPRRQTKLPLALGIREQIIARCPDLSPTAIKASLRDYTAGLVTYRSQLVYGADRVDLDGFSVGTVSLAECVHAGTLLVEAGYFELAAALQRSLPARAA